MPTGKYGTGDFNHGCQKECITMNWSKDMEYIWISKNVTEIYWRRCIIWRGYVQPAERCYVRSIENSLWTFLEKEASPRVQLCRSTADIDTGLHVHNLCSNMKIISPIGLIGFIDCI
jgi:hypothetical protein